MRKTNRRLELIRERNSQLDWIDRCGGNLGGYLINYTPTHGDEGARRIYDADLSQLRRIETAIARLST